MAGKSRTDRNEIILLSEQGLTIAEIAQRLNRNYKTISRIVKSLRRAGVTVKDNQHLTRGEVIRLSEQGLTIREIASRLGMARKSIRGAILSAHRAGIHVKNNSTLHATRDQVINLAEQGLSIPEIARRLNKDEESVRFHFNRNNLQNTRQKRNTRERVKCLLIFGLNAAQIARKLRLHYQTAVYHVNALRDLSKSALVDSAVTSLTKREQELTERIQQLKKQLGENK